MKVALIHDYLYSFGGAEQVLIALTELFPEAPIYTYVKDLKLFPKEVGDYLSKKDVRSSSVSKLPIKRALSKFMVPVTKNWFENLDLSEYELVISDGTLWSKGVKTTPDQTHIYYCHTPARFLYGLPSESQKTRNLPGLKSIVNIIENNLRDWDVLTSNNPDQIIANSINVKERIKNHWNKDSVVVYPPVGSFQVLSTKSIANYYLVVSRLEPYKNVDKVIEAFNLLGHKLIVVGRGSEKVGLKMMAGTNIEFLEGVSKEKLENLYVNSKGVILSAEEEDFGITAIEAASAGVPVVALRSGGFKETVKEGITGVFYEQNTVGAILEAVKRLESQEFNREGIMEEVRGKYTKQKFKENFMRVVSESIKS